MKNMSQRQLNSIGETKLITPIQKIHNLGTNNIYIKRDDLLPFSFGGNKARISNEYFIDIKKKNKNCIIAYGNPRSNLCRVISNQAFSLGLPCYIISPSDDDGSREKTNNANLTELCNASIIPCTKNNVFNTISQIIEECKNNGLDPYYVNGDIYGNGNEATPVQAYIKVYSEIQEQKGNLNFDYIFVATGTGMTLAGLTVGKGNKLGKEKIVGISVARDREKALKTTKKYCKPFINDSILDVEIDDSYISGGYGKYNYDELATIRNLYCNEGILLDPVYVGKAFWGMKQYIRKHNIENSNILFIHTGGTPLSFDMINHHFWNSSFRKINKEQVDEMINFLNVNSNQFATDLSTVTNIQEYSDKILSKGYAYGYYSNDTLYGIICGYANDNKTQTAFSSCFVIEPSVRGTGVASMLFELQYEHCKSSGMKKLIFTTDKRNVAAKKFYEKQSVPINHEIKDEKLIHYCMTI